MENDRLADRVSSCHVTLTASFPVGLGGSFPACRRSLQCGALSCGPSIRNVYASMIIGEPDLGRTLAS
jgi:hypothetical protein